MLSDVQSQRVGKGVYRLIAVESSFSPSPGTPGEGGVRALCDSGSSRISTHGPHPRFGLRSPLAHSQSTGRGNGDNCELHPMCCHSMQHDCWNRRQC